MQYSSKRVDHTRALVRVGMDCSHDVIETFRLHNETPTCRFAPCCSASCFCTQQQSLGVHRLSLAPARRRANRLPIIPPQRIGQETGRDIASRSACGKSKRLRRKRAPARQYTRSQNKCDRGNFNVPTTSPGLSCLDPLPSKNQGPAVGEPLFARDTLGGTLNDNRSERGSCLSEGSGRSVSAGSLRSTADSLDSVDSMNSLGTCSFPTEVFPLSDASFSETDRDTAFAADGQVGRLGVVDRTLFDSWKELPWQARLCPRAIEEQEDIRRASARKEEVQSVNHVSLLLTALGCVSYSNGCSFDLRAVERKVTNAPLNSARYRKQQDIQIPCQGAHRKT